MPKSDTKPPAPTPRRKLAAPNAAHQQRFELRNKFFETKINARQLLDAFNHLPDVLYFVKDVESRLMAVSPEVVTRMGFKSDEEIIGRPLYEYMPPALADKYQKDDRLVIRGGAPILNIVEMYYNQRGACDWIMTNKYPLRDARGEVVGLIGTVQTLEGRQKLLAHLGPVGEAADFIRSHLGEPLMLSDVARRAGFSERQMQRLFLRVFGITIQQFIIHSRIRAAIRELTHSDRTISEIASMFGFSDQSAFTNQFRGMLGVPPGSYRKCYFAQFAP
jgi:PAS domain S-box-containing protein